MRALVEALCDDACAGRKTGSPGGQRARGLIVDAFRDAGLDPDEQAIGVPGGANVIATIPGDSDRWVMVAAHYDHLGQSGADIYRGADDNAAAVAMLVETGRNLAAARPDGRGVIVAAFDAEEPPHFMSANMGSQHYVREPSVPIAKIDLMVCMDLVGHALGSDELPASVRNSVFALGAERSLGTAAMVDDIHEDGAVVRRIDAQVIPPLSDYLAFWEARVPFLFLTNGRWAHYHTPADTPDKLAWDKMAATQRWLEQLVRRACSRDDEIRFQDERDDVSTLRSAIALCEAVASEEAAMARSLATELLAACDRDGRLPAARAGATQMLVAMLESRLSGG